MPDKPLVSIALRSYNQKGFLREAILSILDQSYSPFEIIIADDASNDGSVELIKEFALLYPKIIIPLFHEKNIGHTKNFNSAINLCKGKYIAVFDGDDIMLPEKLKLQCEFMEKHPECCISYHNTEYFNHHSGEVIYLKNNLSNSYEGGIKTMIKYGMFNTNISSMIRRINIPKQGADERISVASDWIFYVECLMAGGMIMYIDKVLARVRRHEGNVTQRRLFKNLFDQYLSSFIILRKYPRYFPQIIFRWFNGLYNQMCNLLFKKK